MGFAAFREWLPAVQRLSTATASRPEPGEPRRTTVAALTRPRPLPGGRPLTPDRIPASHRSDPRQMSARQVAELSQTLYQRGWLSYEESRLLGFQPDLRAETARVLRPLSQQPRSADAPRDQIAAWEARLAFARTYLPEDTTRIARIQSILRVLAELAAG
jgi:hypothetical protein